MEKDDAGGGGGGAKQHQKTKTPELQTSERHNTQNTKTPTP